MPTEATLDGIALLRLMTWLSPAFPIGGFAWSGGLEAACRSGLVADADGLEDWCRTALSHGSLHNDAILLAAAHRGDDPTTLDEMAMALATSPERFTETREQGRAFMQAAHPWLKDEAADCALPVTIGHVASQGEVPLAATLNAYLHAAVSQQVQAALRLMPLGQQAATALLARLEPAIIAAAKTAERSTLEDLGNAAPIMDICSMRHTNLDSRIFRS